MNNNSKSKKADRQNLYVTLVVILMMVAVVIAIAASLARSTKKAADAETTEKEPSVTSPYIDNDAEEDDKPSIDTEDVFLSDGEKEEPDDTEDATEPEDTQNTDSAPNTADKEVSALPEFVSPVRGEVIRECSLTVPVFSQTMEDYRTHTGVDLYCAQGSDVAVVADGTVKEIWDDPMMGMCISVEHSGNAVSVYKNLYDEIPEGIEAGSKVSRGQIIATAGDTALLELCEDSHLHFELLVNGENVDPCEYIKFPSSSEIRD